MKRNFGLYINGEPADRGASIGRPTLRDEQPSTQSSDLERGAKWFGTACILGPLVIFGLSYLVVDWLPRLQPWMPN